MHRIGPKAYTFKILVVTAKYAAKFLPSFAATTKTKLSCKGAISKTLLEPFFWGTKKQ